MIARSVKALVPVLFACLMTACATVEIETNKDPAGVKVLERVYVLVDAGEVKLYYDDATVGECLRGKIEAGLLQRSIDAKAVVVSGLELGQASIEKDVAAFNAATVLTIELIDGIVEGHNFLLIGNLKASLFDFQSGSIVWAAKIKLGSSGSVGGVSEKTVDDIVAKMLAAMTADGLLRPATVASGT